MQVLLSQAFDTIDSGAVHLDPGSVDATLGWCSRIFWGLFSAGSSATGTFFVLLKAGSVGLGWFLYMWFSASNQFVFINFYADWCRFSNMLAPIWDEAADKVKEHFGDNSKIVVAKVDCDKHREFRVNTAGYYSECSGTMWARIFLPPAWFTDCSGIRLEFDPPPGLSMFL